MAKQANVSMFDCETTLNDAARKVGAKAHVSRHWMTWCDAIVTFSAETVARRGWDGMAVHLLARIMPHFDIVDTVRNSDGSYTSRGSLRGAK